MKQVYILTLVIALLLGLSWLMENPNTEEQPPNQTIEIEEDINEMPTDYNRNFSS